MRNPTVTKSFFAGLAACLLWAGTVKANPIAKWDFSGSDGAASEASPSTHTAGIKVSPITRGEGALPTKPTPFTENGFALALVSGVNSIEDAIEKKAYFEFTITPEPGKTMTVESIRFASKRASKMSGPDLFVIRTSQDNFENDASMITKTLPVNVPEGGDLEAALEGSFSKISKPLTIRFYGYGRKQPDNPEGGIWVIGNNSQVEGFTVEGRVQ